MALVVGGARPGRRRRAKFAGLNHLAHLLVFVALLLAGCQNRDATPDQKPASAAPKANELPPLVVRPDTPNLLLTWIDEKGDFHVVQKPADVPSTAKKS